MTSGGICGTPVSTSTVNGGCYAQLPNGQIVAGISNGYGGYGYGGYGTTGYGTTGYGYPSYGYGGYPSYGYGGGGYGYSPYSYVPGAYYVPSMGGYYMVYKGRH